MNNQTKQWLDQQPKWHNVDMVLSAIIGVLLGIIFGIGMVL